MIEEAARSRSVSPLNGAGSGRSKAQIRILEAQQRSSPQRPTSRHSYSSQNRSATGTVGVPSGDPHSRR